MNDEAGITGWILAAISTVVGTLAGLVAMFYKQQIARYETNEADLKKKIDILEKRADACEIDREALRIRYAVLEERVTKLESTKPV